MIFECVIKKIASKNETILPRTIIIFLDNYDEHGFKHDEFKEFFVTFAETVFEEVECENDGISSSYKEHHRIPKTLACFKFHLNHLKENKNETAILEILDRHLDASFEAGNKKPSKTFEVLHYLMMFLMGEDWVLKCYPEGAYDGYRNRSRIRACYNVFIAVVKHESGFYVVVKEYADVLYDYIPMIGEGDAFRYYAMQFFLDGLVSREGDCRAEKGDNGRENIQTTEDPVFADGPGAWGWLLLYAFEDILI